MVFPGISCHLREVRKEDSTGILALANQASVRRWSFTSHEISMQEHSNWFSRRISNHPLWFYVLCGKAEEILGYIRFERVNGFCTVSLALDESLRGKGVGSRVLGMALQKLSNEGFNEEVHAHVKHGNLASERLFAKAGFVLEPGLSYDLVNVYVHGKLKNRIRHEKVSD